MYSARHSGDKEESREMGLLMEWVWHYIFGEEAISKELLRDVGGGGSIGGGGGSDIVNKLWEFEQATLEGRSWCVA